MLFPLRFAQHCLCIPSFGQLWHFSLVFPETALISGFCAPCNRQGCFCSCRFYLPGCVPDNDPFFRNTAQQLRWEHHFRFLCQFTLCLQKLIDVFSVPADILELLADCLAYLFSGTFFTPGQVQVILSGIPAVHPWNVIIKSSAGHRLHQESRFRCSHRNLFHLYPDGFHHPVLEHPVCCMQWSSHWFHWERHLSGAYGTHFDWKTQYFQGIYAYFLLLSSHYIKMHK